jgi:hypothetical protein
MRVPASRRWLGHGKFMTLQTLNKICFTICILCIVLGTVLSMVMIWMEVRDDPVVWKSWLSICVLFLASLLTLSVSKTLGFNAVRDSK